MKPIISMLTLGVKDLEESVKLYKDGSDFLKIKAPLAIANFASFYR